MNNTSVPDDKILFLLKTMQHEFLDDTINKGRFCFNQPAVFSKWEDESAAQADRWEAHDSYEATHLIVAPIIGEKDGRPIYGKAKEFSNNAIIHTQSNEVKRSFICCFRAVTAKEVIVEQNRIYYSLDSIIDRIKNEFRHDAYVFIPIGAFLERFNATKPTCMYGSVTYADVLNDVELEANVPERLRSVAEQLFRKDKRFEWQQEYRIALPPDPNVDGQKKFVEIGSIEDIASYGLLEDLRD